MQSKLLYQYGMKNRTRKKRWRRWDKELRIRVKRVKGSHRRGYPLPRWFHYVANLILGQRVIDIAKEVSK